MVSRAAGRQRAQTVRGEKMATADPHDSRLIVRRERTVGHAGGEDLVRPDAGIVTIRTINYVVQTLAVGAHESCKTSPRDFSRSAEAVWLSQSFGERAHDAQGIVPEWIDFDRLANAWGDHPIADLRNDRNS